VESRTNDCYLWKSGVAATDGSRPLVHLQCLEQKTNPTKVLSIREAQSRSRSRERLAAVELIIPLRHKAFTSDAPSDWIDRFSGSEVR
jgi:hypothetical protein